MEESLNGVWEGRTVLGRVLGRVFEVGEMMEGKWKAGRNQ